MGSLAVSPVASPGAAVRDLLRRPALRSLTGILSAQVVNNLVSFVVLVITARVMGPREFGIFALALSVAQLLSIVLDSGLGLTTVRIYNATPDRAEAERMIETVVAWKLVILIALLALGYPAERLLLSVALASLSEAQPLFYAATVTGGLLSVWTSLLAIMQAKRDFAGYQRLTYSYAFLRATCSVLLFTAATRSPSKVFLALYTAPLAVLLAIGLPKLSSATASWSRNVLRVDAARLRRALAYGGWVATSSLCYTALSRLPQFALIRNSPEQVGLYSAGLTFIAVFSLMNDAVRTLLVPEVASLRTGGARTDFRAKLWRWSPAFLAVLALTFVAAGFVQWQLLGPAYRDSVPVFAVLALATAVTVYLGLFNTLVHSHGIPSADATVNLGRLAVLTVLLFVVPLTALRAAFMFGAVLVVGEATLYAIVLRRERSGAA